MIPGIPLHVPTLMDLIQVDVVILHLPKAVSSPTLFVNELLCISEDLQDLERSISGDGEGAGIAHSLHQPALESKCVVPMQRDMLDPQVTLLGVGTVIVAMKGHPGTGKSTIAEAIATSLRCPLLDKDDIRDATLSLSSAASAALNDLSYDALWRIAATQIRLGLSVVLDSPLSRRRHLDRILTIAGNHRVLIVECLPSDHAEWRRRLERRAAEQGRGHKPATWEDLERLLQGYDGCTEYDVGEVPRLVVDTTGTGALHGMLSAVMEFIQLHRGHAHHQPL